MNAITTYGANMTAAIRTSLMDRTNFILNSFGMVLNDIFFLLLWYMFFAGFRQVGGWGLHDVALLLGLIMLVVSISGVFFGGYRDMAATILRGEIDALLTQPKGVLLRLLARESIATAWGDLVMGIWMLITFAALSWSELPLVLLALVCGTTIYLSCAIAYASLAFWFAGARSFARDLTDFMLLFSSYPGSIFSGMTKVIAYTLLPAGFIVLTPVALLRAPTLASFAILIGATLGYASIAALLFHLGLRRYRQGLVPTG
ncbi:MAG: ABC-2 family transporter protein [Alphaproteobacteria bacterium]|nr:ABC-2 family transporter protein [Alphaproteobacteria bacterium]MBV9540023.1 ABC-2 family transporter protein [Alphaproteobacteria bacterium]MBV9905542.1 ABC-2 family transporter protein [Alphaproteobacteria bacterium]